MTWLSAERPAKLLGACCLFSLGRTTSSFRAGRPRPPTARPHHATTCLSFSISNTSMPSASDAPDSLRFIRSIREIADDYDIFLLDMWGVMHDGSKPYKGVLDTIRKLKEHSKELIILSNSSKRQENSVRMLSTLGFDTTDFSQIITSGEVSFCILEGDTTLPCDTWSIVSDLRATQRQRVFVFGSGAQDEDYVASCGWTLAPVEEADLIVARGTFTINDGTAIINKKKDGREKYFEALETALKTAANRQVPMLVTNPDKVRPDEGLPPMPGAIGDAYEAVLGSDCGVTEKLVKRIGKPFTEVFQLALHGKDASRACMIGDALETDVTGGSIAGITTIWVVNDGIHGPAVMETESMEEGSIGVLQKFNAKDGTYARERVLKPNLVIPNFRW